jgi:hypothetical protein
MCVPSGREHQGIGHDGAAFSDERHLGGDARAHPRSTLAAPALMAEYRSVRAAMGCSISCGNKARRRSRLAPFHVSP